MADYIKKIRTADGDKQIDYTALANLPNTVNVTLQSSGWSSLQQTVDVAGVTASNTVIVSSSPSNYRTYNGHGVYCSAQAAGKLTFKTATTPTVNLVVQVLIMP